MSVQWMMKVLNTQDHLLIGHAWSPAVVGCPVFVKWYMSWIRHGQWLFCIFPSDIEDNKHSSDEMVIDTLHTPPCRGTQTTPNSASCNRCPSADWSLLWQSLCLRADSKPFVHSSQIHWYGKCGSMSRDYRQNLWKWPHDCKWRIWDQVYRCRKGSLLNSFLWIMALLQGVSLELGMSCVFLDLKKAFDSVPYTALLNKLCACGTFFNGLIATYLEDCSELF